MLLGLAIASISRYRYTEVSTCVTTSSTELSRAEMVQIKYEIVSTALLPENLYPRS